MENKIVDSHCHLNMLGRRDECYEENRSKIILEKLKLAKENHLSIIQNICVTLEEFAEFYPLIFNKENGILKQFQEINGDFQIYTSLGVHPLYPEHEFNLDLANEFVKYEFVNAIGECGLDYQNNPDISARRHQQKNFLLQIDLAARTNLPLIVHTRCAEDQTYHYLYHAFLQRGIKGVMHCFTGSKKLALKMIDLGFFISFPGIITFKKKIEYLHEIICEIPLEKILIETDSPYLAPEPFRGRENQPAFVFHVCKKIAEIKKLDIEEVAFQTTKNYKDLFLSKYNLL